MNFLNWFFGLLIILCLIVLIFKVGGYLINLILIVSVVTLFVDILTSRKNYR